MERGESSTSRARQDNREPRNAFDGITPQASVSSSAVMKKRPCDVFINHRGCDTKHKLASTIYHTLDLIELHAFLDEKELELGDSIPEEIQEVMRTAQLHIAIFSERYAESPWCLAELSYMLKTGTPIIPVFYHVDSSDLRWVAQEKGLYAPAFSHHKRKRRYPTSMLEDWKRALERVSNLSGHVLNSTTGDEGMLLKSIVNSILRVMKKEPLEVAKHPVGMDTIVDDFERSRGKSIQTEEHGQIVGIVGFGGSGKTTLATELYNRKSSSFNRSSFLRDVRDAASKNALHTKQKKLLQDLHIQTASFDNEKDGKAFVADQLKSLCILVVLDDVDHEDQLDALLPPRESLGSGSVVIITTREGDVLTKWGITCIYKIKPLQHLHAKQLFCWHAFLQPFPLKGFEDLVENCIDACNGLPLSLKVIGGQLYGKKSKDHWVSQIDKIRRILPKEILERLKVSYDALDEEEQEIFLDIACFFIGEKKSTAIGVWDGSGWSGLHSWEILHNKCLVEVVHDYDGQGSIRMHDHLRDLGRKIAETHSPSRIWCEKRTPFQGITATRNRRVGLKGENDFPEECEELSSEECEELSSEDCKELSRDLLWLQWPGFNHRCIPSWLSLETIRVLEITRAYVLETLWEDTHPPLQLRELLIAYAPKLQSLPRSIGRLKHLKRLSLRLYEDLSSLPEEFCQLRSLEHLDLGGCNGLSSLPNCFGDLVNLQHLDLSYCRRLKRLPESFKQLIHLKYLGLNGCHSLESLENIANVKSIYFSKGRSGTIGDQTSVGQLSLSFTDLSHNVIPDIGQLNQLEELVIYSWQSLTRLPTSLGKVSSLTTLKLKNCYDLESLPIEVGQLSSLQTLKIESCYQLREMPSLAGLVSLNNLVVEDCNQIHKIDGLEHLTSLEKLLLWTCWMVTGIYSLGRAERLRTLNLRAYNISAFVPCIESIQLEKWPWETTICGRLFPHFQPILDSFTFPGLAVVDSFDPPIRQWSLTCRETNLSNAALVCYLVRGFGYFGHMACIKEGESTSVEVGDGEWIVMCVFREVSRLVEDGGRSLRASFEWRSLPRHVEDDEVNAFCGRLMVGERGCVVEGFKQLLRSLCNAALTSQYYYYYQFGNFKFRV